MPDPLAPIRAALAALLTLFDDKPKGRTLLEVFGDSLAASTTH